MVKHIVMWKIQSVNHQSKQETAQDIKAALEDLNGKIIETIPLAEDIPTIGTVTLNLSNYRWIVFEVITNSYQYAISNPIYLK